MSFTNTEMKNRFNKQLGLPKKYSRTPADYSDFYNKIMSYSDDEIEKISRKFKKTLKDNCELQRKYFKEFKSKPYKIKIDQVTYDSFIKSTSFRNNYTARREKVINEFGDYLKFAYTVLHKSKSELASEFNVAGYSMSSMLNKLGLPERHGSDLNKVNYLRRLVIVLLAENRRFETILKRRS